MASTKADENYEMPSKHKQWHEKSEYPIASRPMSRDEIEEHRLNLVRSYQCNDTDITFVFQKIRDTNDEDRDDCLWLKYLMKCVVAGQPTVREIFSIKLPIPEELRKMAERMRRQQANQPPARRKPVLITTGETGINPSITDEQSIIAPPSDVQPDKIESNPASDHESSHALAHAPASSKLNPIAIRKINAAKAKKQPIKRAAGNAHP